jgi:putative transposase
MPRPSLLIEPGKLTQNAYIESFNGKFRDEYLNEHWFQSLTEARVRVATWLGAGQVFSGTR